MTPAELHAEAMQHYAMAHHYLGKLKTTLDQMGSASAGLARVPVRCVREWQDWLAIHGPAFKSDIAEQTGVRFTERGTPYTVEWTPSLATEPDDHFDPSTLMKISDKSVGRGRPPVIFFLWSQRFDVHPRFQVGPIREETHSNEIPDGSVAVHFDPTIAAAGGVRCVNMTEWDDLHAWLFDGMVVTDTKPTDEQKEMLRNSLPEGEDANAAIAIAIRNARLRTREPAALTGVVTPVSSHPISPAHGEELAIDWDAP